MIKRFLLVLLTLLLVGSLNSDISFASKSNQIDDANFYDNNSMSESQIANWISSKYPSSCLLPQNYPSEYNNSAWRNNAFKEPLPGDTFGGEVSPSRIIWRVSQLYGLNPKVVLTTLEKESDLVSGSKGCSAWRYNSAMGYNCWTGAENYLKDYPAIGISQTCVQKQSYAGFSPQVDNGTWQLSFDGKRANGDLSWGGWGNITYYGRMTQGNRARVNGGTISYYDGYTTINGEAVYLSNGPTAALYNYTPFFSRFETIFTDWFGSPTGYPTTTNTNIPSGNYVISGLSSNKALDVQYGQSVNGAPVQLYQQNGTGAQIWNINRLSSGYYSIKNVQSGKFLDVPGAYSNSGTQLHIWDGNGTCAQKWVIEKSATNSYVFVNECAGLAMGVKDSATNDGAVVQVATKESDSSQSWLLLPASSNPLQDGLYTLNTSTNYSIDIPGGSTSSGTKVQIYSNNSSDAQIWQFIKQTTGLYKIRNPQSGKYLTAQNEGTALGTKIEISDDGSSCTQQWSIRNDGSYYTLGSSCSGLALDVSGGSISTNGATVQLWSSNGSNAQRWKLGY